MILMYPMKPKPSPTPASLSHKAELENILRDHKKVLSALKSEQDAILVESQILAHMDEASNDSRG
jgi:hypothetical protein